MPRNSRISNIHANRLKDIRKFVSFDYDLRKPLSAAAKRKIKTYHDEISALTNRPYQAFRPRSKDHLVKAQEFAQHGKSLPGLKVAFIPTDGQNKVRLKFNKSGVVGKTVHVSMSLVPLDVRKLIADPEKHVNDRIRGNDATSYTVQAGRYEIPAAYIPATIAKAVARLTAKYGSAGGVEKDNNHYFGRWLHGLKAYRFENQADVGEYLATKQKNIKTAKRLRRAAKRRAIRKAAK